MLEPLEHSTTTLDSNKRIEPQEENDVKTYLPASQWRFLNLISILGSKEGNEEAGFFVFSY